MGEGNQSRRNSRKLSKTFQKWCSYWILTSTHRDVFHPSGFVWPTQEVSYLEAPGIRRTSGDEHNVDMLAALLSSESVVKGVSYEDSECNAPRSRSLVVSEPQAYLLRTTMDTGRLRYLGILLLFLRLPENPTKASRGYRCHCARGRRECQVLSGEARNVSKRRR